MVWSCFTQDVVDVQIYSTTTEKAKDNLEPAIEQMRQSDVLKRSNHALQSVVGTRLTKAAIPLETARDSRLTGQSRESRPPTSSPAYSTNRLFLSSTGAHNNNNNIRISN